MDRSFKLLSSPPSFFIPRTKDTGLRSAGLAWVWLLSLSFFLSFFLSLFVSCRCSWLSCSSSGCFCFCLELFSSLVEKDVCFPWSDSTSCNLFDEKRCLGSSQQSSHVQHSSPETNLTHQDTSAKALRTLCVLILIFRPLPVQSFPLACTATKIT